MKKALIIGLIGVGILGAYRIVTHHQRAQSKNGKAAVAIPVEVVPAKKTALWDTLELTGDIRGAYEAKIFPKVPGKLKQRTAEVGITVTKGQAIATIDRDEPALSFSLADVTSPLDGVITKYYANEGETVSPSQPIAEVATIDSIKIVVQVSEKDLSRVFKGQDVRFTIDSYPNRRFTGTVTTVSPGSSAANARRR